MATTAAVQNTALKRYLEKQQKLLKRKLQLQLERMQVSQAELDELDREIANL